MKIIIEIPNKEGRENKSVLDYFYIKCLDLFILNEVERFTIQIEGTELKRSR